MNAGGQLTLSTCTITLLLLSYMCHTQLDVKDAVRTHSGKTSCCIGQVQRTFGHVRIRLRLACQGPSG